MTDSNELEQLRGELIVARNRIAALEAHGNELFAILEKADADWDLLEGLCARYYDAAKRFQAERDAAERKCVMAEQAAQRWHDDYGHILAERDALKAELAEVREKLSDAIVSADASFTTYLETVRQRDGLRAERDAANATITRVRELRDRWYREPGMSEEADALDAALDASGGTESIDLI